MAKRKPSATAKANSSRDEAGRKNPHAAALGRLGGPDASEKAEERPIAMAILHCTLATGLTPFRADAITGSAAPQCSLAFNFADFYRWSKALLFL